MRPKDELQKLPTLRFWTGRGVGLRSCQVLTKLDVGPSLKSELGHDEDL